MYRKQIYLNTVLIVSLFILLIFTCCTASSFVFTGSKKVINELTISCVDIVNSLIINVVFNSIILIIAIPLIIIGNKKNSELIRLVLQWP